MSSPPPGVRLTAPVEGVYGHDVADPIRVRRGVRVPATAISWRAVRSSGPGGQNVNKVASKVELRVDLEAVEGLDDAARHRLAALSIPRLDSRGRLLVTSQRTRDQSRNLEDARDKVRRLVARALVAPKRRRRTRPTAAAVEERLRDKHLRGARKRERRAVGRDEA
jgi:ribosome-associated protein